MPPCKRTPQIEENASSQEEGIESDHPLEPDPITPVIGGIGDTPTRGRITLTSDREITTGHEVGGGWHAQASSTRSHCEDGLQRSLSELQQMLGSRGYKRLPRHLRAEVMMALLEHDDELLPDDNRGRTTPVAIQGSHYPSGRYPPIGGNPRRQTGSGTVSSRPQAVAAQVLEETDRCAEAEQFHRAR